MAGLSLEEKRRLLNLRKENEPAKLTSRSARQPAINQGSVVATSGTNTKATNVSLKPKTDRYAAVSSANTGKLASLTWTDAELTKIHVYRVGILTSAKCISLGQKLVDALNAGKVETTTGDVCLTLALSLCQPGTSGFHTLLRPIPSDTGLTQPFSQPDGAVVTQTLSAVDRAKLAKAKEKLELEETSEADREKYEGIVQSLERQEAGESSAGSSTTRLVNESDAIAYGYLAAYLLKLAGRDEAMFNESLPTMVMRYSAWFDGDTAILRGFKPKIDTLKSLRMVFNRRPEILSTWMLTIAVNENAASPLPQTHQGLLNFLACQQYAYTGMHAYKLILDIHESSGISYSTLLAGFDCPNTRNGVMEVLGLIRDHEVTKANPTRSTYFRYARVWNPKYFVSLQSSNCKALVYVAAKVAKQTGAQKAGGDPTEIMAIKNLDNLMKDRLNEVANKMSHAIFDIMLYDEESGDAWK